MSKNGLFITFEGGEGSGKTTQINKLSQALSHIGRKVITTREPGGTPEGEAIRDLLVQRNAGDWTPISEVLLLYAARHMHIEKIIKPALENNKVVVCDRFFDSTLAYQGYGHGMDLEIIKTIHQTTLGDFKPDLTFILDIDPEQGLARSDRRLAAEKFVLDQQEDRYEQMDISFHERLRQGFLSIAKEEPNRCIVIDALQDTDTIAGKVADAVRERLD